MPLGLSSCRVGAYTLSYRRAGAGDPVVLVHGFLAHSFVWDGVIALVAPRHDVIALDLLGCGASDLPADADLGLAAHAGRLLAFLDVLALPRVHLVGHGVGGAIALLAAVRAPWRVRTVTTVNAAGYGREDTPLMRLVGTRFLPEAIYAVARVFARPLLRRRLGPGARVPPGMVEAFVSQYAAPQARAALRRFARDVIGRHELSGARDLLRHLTVPTTLVWGMADRFRSFTTAERLHQDIPGARLVRLAGAGHLVPLDAPAPLAELLEEAFRRT
jgi:pimeloyl-ACP methyl ester carboxylesterase